MARTRIPFEESATHEVYQCYKDYVIQNEEYPNPHAFWKHVLIPQLGYQMPWGSFQYHIMQLQIRRLVVVNEVTKAVRLPELDIVEKERLLDLP